MYAVFLCITVRSVSIIGSPVLTLLHQMYLMWNAATLHMDCIVVDLSNMVTPFMN